MEISVNRHGKGDEELLHKPHVREAMLWEPLRDRPGYVRCSLCARRCIIAPGRYGVCGVRKNINGKLYTLVYGLLTAMNIDPIEKKPLYHFEPGSGVLSISTVGCNFFCQFCQNWEISQSRLERGLYGHYVPPDEVVRKALDFGAEGIAYTYNEPTIFFEYMYDVARLAKKHNLYNVMVTNGYITPEAIRMIGPYMDGATVDFKGSGNPEFYRKFMAVPDPSPIYDALLEMKKQGWWIEITNLVVPKYGDREEDLRRLARWIVENLGPDIPFHLLRFHPDYRLLNLPPTPVETLEKLAKIAKEEGLHYVYIGNVWGHPLENTYCPKCNYAVVERRGFTIIAWRLTKDNQCPKCGHRIAIRGKFHGGGGVILPLMVY
ncbi:AmmeMemoRadiSam system radical SAM enzyme [Hyperthermus butylicus]|uniref:Pyruvate-formate lyase-activating enzyme, PflA n=1 Tax=Hyperthermus butylicus (strain DSM 5456 / JCM 9403 / PLM1-5) TaxID=415426 RepID=A2BK43_HYPBU|nr:AmmeMemoRadiSam system radical SAM enzyme [Hyperthermus butylicus]ABM80354.1 pyruvate-formate lyase-activating enzyme, PflA [Hyperthermus butylicus DSM 5456]